MPQSSTKNLGHVLPEYLQWKGVATYLLISCCASQIRGDCCCVVPLCLMRWVHQNPTMHPTTMAALSVPARWKLHSPHEVSFFVCTVPIYLCSKHITFSCILCLREFSYAEPKEASQDGEEVAEGGWFGQDQEKDHDRETWRQCCCSGRVAQCSSGCEQRSCLRVHGRWQALHGPLEVPKQQDPQGAVEDVGGRVRVANRRPDNIGLRSCFHGLHHCLAPRGNHERRGESRACLHRRSSVHGLCGSTGTPSTLDPPRLLRQILLC